MAEPMTEREVCPECHGYGAPQHRGSQEPCATCHGTGRVPPPPDAQLLMPLVPIQEDEATLRYLMERIDMIERQATERDHNLSLRLDAAEATLHTFGNHLAQHHTRLGAIESPEPGVPDLDSPSPVPPADDPGGA